MGCYHDPSHSYILWAAVQTLAVILTRMMLCLNNGLRNWLEKEKKKKSFFLGFKNGKGRAKNE